MSGEEILMELSIAQKELSETYRLTKKTQSLDLVSEQFQYTIGEESTNINADILDIDHIIVSPLMKVRTITVIPATGGGYGYSYGLEYGGPVMTVTQSEEAGHGFNYGLDYGGSGVSGAPVSGDQGTPESEVVTISEVGSVLSRCHFSRFLKKSSLAEMGNWDRLAGLPGQYSFFDADGDSVLWIDSLPSDFTDNSTMRLFIIYNRKMYLFGDSEGNSTWGDYDPFAEGYGGEFKLPNQFHSLMVDGALVNAFPDMYRNYMIKVQQMVRSKPISISGQLKYSLGA